MTAPNEIEAGLAFKGIDIGWWHRHTRDDDGYPKLSSRRLLALVDELPEMSSYKTGRRDGQWPLWMQMLKEVHKETAMQRAASYASDDDPNNELAKYSVFLDPLEVREQAEELEAETEFVDEAETELYDALDWS